LTVVAVAGAAAVVAVDAVDAVEAESLPQAVIPSVEPRTAATAMMAFSGRIYFLQTEMNCRGCASTFEARVR
jgi:hypothetical protein